MPAIISVTSLKIYMKLVLKHVCQVNAKTENVLYAAFFHPRFFLQAYTPMSELFTLTNIDTLKPFESRACSQQVNDSWPLQARQRRDTILGHRSSVQTQNFFFT